jgi:hypothetical protein
MPSSGVSQQMGQEEVAVVIVVVVESEMDDEVALTLRVVVVVVWYRAVRTTPALLSRGMIILRRTDMIWFQVEIKLYKE